MKETDLRQALKTLDETIKVFEDDFVQSNSDVAHRSSLCDYNRLVIEGGCVAARFVTMARFVTKVTNCGGSVPFFSLIYKDLVIGTCDVWFVRGRGRGTNTPMHAHLGLNTHMHAGVFGHRNTEYLVLSKR